MQKKKGRWSGFLNCTPVHLCTGGSSKEGSKNNHRIKNKEANNWLGSEAVSFHLAAERSCLYKNTYIKIDT